MVKEIPVLQGAKALIYLAFHQGRLSMGALIALLVAIAICITGSVMVIAMPRTALTYASGSANVILLEGYSLLAIAIALIIAGGIIGAVSAHKAALRRRESLPFQSPSDIEERFRDMTRRLSEELSKEREKVRQKTEALNLAERQFHASLINQSQEFEIGLSDKQQEYAALLDEKNKIEERLNNAIARLNRMKKKEDSSSD
ncbi:hypothetical protein [Pokkaliibacter plantistimulans]|nr:hypothetical protein [Pokkaliibacter plantistimulans]